MTPSLNDVSSSQSVDILQPSSLIEMHALLTHDARVKLDQEKLLEWRKRLEQIRDRGLR